MDSAGHHDTAESEKEDEESCHDWRELRDYRFCRISEPVHLLLLMLRMCDLSPHGDRMSGRKSACALIPFSVTEYSKTGSENQTIGQYLFMYLLKNIDTPCISVKQYLYD